MCDLLTCADPRIITVALEGLENILRVGERDAKSTGGVNLYGQYVEEAEGLNKIEELQNHQNNDIYEKAVKILEQYFAAEEDDASLNPAVDQNTHQFQFTNTMQAPQGGFKF